MENIQLQLFVSIAIGSSIDKNANFLPMRVVGKTLSIYYNKGDKASFVLKNGSTNTQNPVAHNAARLIYAIFINGLEGAIISGIFMPRGVPISDNVLQTTPVGNHGDFVKNIYH